MTSGIVEYLFAIMLFNKKRREKSVRKIKKSIKLLSKYSWCSLYKV